MLGRIGNSVCNEPVKASSELNRYDRNEMDDLKKGIEYLYEFKEKLLKLHPIALDAIDNLLQRPRY